MGEKEFNTTLTSVNNTFMPLVEKQLRANGVNMGQYQKQCALMCISAIHNVLDGKGISWKSPVLDKSNIYEIITRVASLQLNAAASPREVYFSIRNVKAQDNEGKTVWKKQVEMGIEGDGNDAILARFGRDVKKVHQYWLVREGDDFEYPQYDGIEKIMPPKWRPKGKGKVVRVVYPVTKTDDSIDYHISEREDVARNLFAHISNNLMNETFGICKSRYDANEKQKKEINEKKAVLLKKAAELGLDAIDESVLQPWISPSYTEFHSRESMIIRKMRNNTVKKIPKDFGNAYIEMTYDDAAEETASYVRKEISENANKETIDLDDSQYTTVDESEEKEPVKKNDSKEDTNPKKNENNNKDNDLNQMSIEEDPY